MRCGGVALAKGRIGRISNNVAVRIEHGIKVRSTPQADGQQSGGQ